MKEVFLKVMEHPYLNSLMDSYRKTNGLSDFEFRTFMEKTILTALDYHSEILRTEWIKGAEEDLKTIQNTDIHGTI